MPKPDHLLPTNAMLPSEVDSTPSSIIFSSQMKTFSLLKAAVLLAVCCFLINVQGCKDPLQGDVPRTLELMSNGDWQRIDGLYGGSRNNSANYECFALIGSTVIQKYGRNIARSTDNGSSWSEIPVFQGVNNTSFTTVAAVGTVFLGGVTAQGRIMRSTDNGNTWSESRLGYDVMVTSLSVQGSNVYAAGMETGAGGGVMTLRSADTGRTWRVVKRLGISKINVIASEKSVFILQSFLSSQGALFVGVFRSNNNGETWDSLSVPATSWNSNLRMAVYNDVILLGDFYKLFRSVNNGATWSEVTNPVGLGFSYMTGLAIDNKGVAFIGSGGLGVFRSNDYGSTWTKIAMPENVTEVTDFIFLKDNIVLAAAKDNLFRSTNGGATWEVSNKGLTASVLHLANQDGVIFAAVGGRGIMVSQNNGQSWRVQNSGLADGEDINRIFVLGTAVFAGSQSNNGQGAGGMYQSENGGTSWKSLEDYGFHDMSKNESAFFAINRYQGIYRSTNNGKTWSIINNTKGCTSVRCIGNLILIASESGILRSSDNGLTWSQNDGPTIANNLYDQERMLCMGNRALFLSNYNEGIFRSLDSGKTWNFMGKGPESRVSSTLVSADDSTLFIGTDNNGVYRSGDAGKTWQLISSNVPMQYLTSLILKDKSLFAGTRSSGLYRLPLR